MRLLWVVLWVGRAALGHGLHAVPSGLYRSDAPVKVQDLGQVIAVERRFPLDEKLCTEHFDETEASCNVRFLQAGPTHLDYASPVPTYLQGKHEVTFEINETGYAVSYWGPSSDKAEQLGYLVKAIRATLPKYPQLIARLYRPAKSRAEIQAQGHLLRAEGFMEIMLAKIIGVHRRILIDPNACQKTLTDKTCWVRVVEETETDHPGPPGGGDVVSKEHIFSDTERVEIELHNLYEQYRISYEGPLTSSTAILGKIKEAIQALKETSTELYLECDMFTAAKRRASAKFLDKKVSDAVYFSVGMPVDYETCAKNHDGEGKRCFGDFSESLPLYDMQHVGGAEKRGFVIDKDGEIKIAGVYGPPSAFWSLEYSIFEGSSLTPLEFLRKGIDRLTELGAGIIRGYGFRSDGHLGM